MRGNIPIPELPLNEEVKFDDATRQAREAAAATKREKGEEEGLAEETALIATLCRI